jgi:hypothetical protein
MIVSPASGRKGGTSSPKWGPAEATAGRNPVRHAPRSPDRRSTPHARGQSPHAGAIRA